MNLCKKFLSEVNKNVYIIDDLFSVDERAELHDTAITSSYIKNNNDFEHNDNKFIFHKWRCNLSLEELSKCAKIPDKLQAVFSTIFPNMLLDLNIITSYINFSDPHSVDRIHIDNFDIDEYLEENIDFFTVLIYGNFEWHSDWKGETVFYNDTFNEIIFSTTMKPGRVIVFEGTIPHSATPPSFLSPFSRYTYAVKLKLKKNEYRVVRSPINLSS